jgi:hypothetical protein
MEIEMKNMKVVIPAIILSGLFSASALAGGTLVGE